MDIVGRLREHVRSDHVRGCHGRQYSCDCGYDLITEGLLELAADEIEQLRAALGWIVANADEVKAPLIVGRARFALRAALKDTTP